MTFVSSGTRPLTVLALLVVITAGWFGHGLAERYFFLRAAEQSQSTLRLAVAGLRGALERFEPLPALLAERPSIERLLSDPGNEDLTLAVNLELKRIAQDVEASDIYLMDMSGLTLAASNYDTETSFVSRNFHYRPYFTAAQAGGLGRYFALGTTSKKRGYYFAAPVRSDGGIAGVTAVKINVDGFEAAWQGNPDEIMVTDENGIIFMSSRPDWRFGTLQSLTPDVIEAIRASRQYPIDRLDALDLASRTFDSGRTRVLTIASGAGDATFIARDETMREAGWTVHVLTPTTAARAQAFAVVFTVLLALLLIALVAAYLMQRRARLVERIAAQREAHEMLERRVEERTSDLNTANTQLRLEVEERTAAERRLHKTQADLVQASKLAALGQMSAALSHEFNQPLAAVKSYAENAATYLDRNRSGEARENISRISELADRMAAISKHLRNFARKPQERIGAVPLATVVNDAVEIMTGKLKSSSVSIAVDIPNAEIWVRGGHVRLQQVLVNLISNALDAMADMADAPPIELCAKQRDGTVVIEVRDHGPGLAEGITGQIFDPFFTTKEVGKGLGLGLSISYNIIKDFGGSLTARNHRGGGAVFAVELDAAERLTGAAAE